MARKKFGLRVSVMVGDPGEELLLWCRSEGRRIDVYLDGKLQLYALTADETTGEVVRYVSDQYGELFVHPTTRCLCKEVVHGKVRIEIGDAKPDRDKGRDSGGEAAD